MIFRQLVHDDLGCASYLIGDEDEGVAAVVDPRLDIDEYLRLARSSGAHRAHLRDPQPCGPRVGPRRSPRPPAPRSTSTGTPPRLRPRAVRRRLGVAARAHHGPRAAHPATAPTHGVRADRLRAERGALGGADRRQPVRGRHRAPDLAVDKAEGAHGIFHSLHEQLLSLPDMTEVWPGHLGGSMCGGPGMDLKVSSTIGFERASQPLLRSSDEDDFVRAGHRGPRTQPPNFQNIVALNRGPLAEESVDAHPLTPRQVRAGGGDGALVVDVRTELQFDEAHIPARSASPRSGAASAPACVAGEARPAARAGGPRRRGRARGGRSPARSASPTSPATCRRHDLLARGEAARRARGAAHPELHERWDGGSTAPAARRARALRVGPRPIRLDPHRLPRSPRAARRARRRAPVAVICASGQRADGRQPAEAAGAATSSTWSTGLRAGSERAGRSSGSVRGVIHAVSSEERSGSSPSSSASVRSRARRDGSARSASAHGGPARAGHRGGGGRHHLADRLRLRQPARAHPGAQGSPTVLLCAHMDTVPVDGPVEVVRSRTGSSRTGTTPSSAPTTRRRWPRSSAPCAGLCATGRRRPGSSCSFTTGEEQALEGAKSVDMSRRAPTTATSSTTRRRSARS